MATMRRTPTATNGTVMSRMRKKIKSLSTLWAGGANKEPLPPNWISTLDERTKRTIYYNTETGESSWFVVGDYVVLECRHLLFSLSVRLEGLEPGLG